MRLAFLFLVAAGFLLATTVAADDTKPAPGGVVPKLPAGTKPDSFADPKEAARVADWLDKEYPAPQPESVRMLAAVLRKGVRIGGQDGWFGPPESRYDWAWLAKRHGLEPAAKAIPADKFCGPAALFDRLDRDGDGAITPTDLDWSDRNPTVIQLATLTRVFRRLDASGDGKATREELDAFFKMAADGKDHVTPDDLRRVVLPRGGYLPGDAPSVPVMVRGLFAGELGSLSEGPKVGGRAPDFTLKSPDGKETITLSKLTGTKPVVLVFGNFTCGPFRALYPEVEAVHQRHKADAHFVMVYVREAHPADGWAMESNTRAGIAVKQPTTLAERAEVCELFRNRLKPAIPVVVDSIADPVNTAYSGVPARLYVIDPDGKVAYKGGRGPFGFKPAEMEQALVLALLEAAPDKKP